MKKKKQCDVESDVSLYVTETGGSSIVRFKSLFTLDSKYLLCPCGNVVKVYSTNTGECCQKLVGHTDTVTMVAHHPCNKLQAITSSTDGTIKLWDYEDGVALSSLGFNTPLYGIYTLPQYPSTAFVVQRTDKRNELCRFKLEFSQPKVDDVEVVANSMDKLTDKTIAFSKGYFVVAQPKSFLVFCKPDKVKWKNRVRHDLNPKEPAIRCIACHPKLEQCVTGHENGELRFWYNLSDSENATFNVQHWHSLPALSLSYTSSGSSVISGGHEGVMVQWTSDGKQFLPRLGSAIQQLTTSNDNQLYATSHNDNSICIVTSYMTVRTTIEGFTATGQSLPCGLNYDPKTQSCVTNGKAGHLLFYFPDNDEQLYNLDIVSRNYISPVDLEKSLPHTKITRVGFTVTANNEHLMATAEYDKENMTDQKLKMWKFDESYKEWCLVTVISSPHDNRNITSLTFHPTNALCVTTAEDGYAKTWTLDDNEGWCCESTTSYRGYASSDSSFSQDGSVLALAFGHTVSLIDPLLLDDLSLLVSARTNIKQIEFGQDSNCHLLVVATENSLQSWSVITSSMIWLIDTCGFNFLVKDPFSDNLAFIDTRHTVHVFQPSDEKPPFTQNVKMEILAACFVQGGNDEIPWCAKSQLYMISNKMTVHKFATKEQSKVVSNRALPVATDTLRTPIASLLSTNKEAVDDITMPGVPIRNRTLQEAVQVVLETKSHVLPPIPKICQQFVAALLLDGANIHEESEDVTAMEVCTTEPSTLNVKPVKTGLKRNDPDPDVDDFDWLAESFANLK
uniref:WD repeat-containing protein 75 n=1 Tax=Ciona intestinalis TaxID=7719 RepID=UPI000180D0FB|nr:WD repeat-containing protein 75 [Ciona intestinalis]|eukprot:XP_002127047.1 WD repeat-containing protein 75 [Ciona intestinalis]